MDTVFEDYLAYSAGVRHFSEKTIEAYRNDLKLFSDWLADNELAFTEVTRTQVRIFVADLGNRHFAPASINRTLSCVRGLYRFPCKVRKEHLAFFASFSLYDCPAAISL